MNGPRQEPDNSEHSAGDFKEFTEWHPPEKSREFYYKDSTEENIGNGESQHFHYEGNDLPEKM